MGRPAARTAAPEGQISRQELLRRHRDARLAVVNVLPRAAYEERRIPGSRSLPVEEISSRAFEVLPDPAQEVVVYCRGTT